jgi:hypothetical protein
MSSALYQGAAEPLDPTTGCGSVTLDRLLAAGVENLEVATGAVTPGDDDTVVADEGDGRVE